jgi:hypothetical protein
LEEFTANLYAQQTESDPMVRRASVDELLGLFGRSLLMVTPFMVWHDLEFEVIAHRQDLEEVDNIW